MVKQKKCQIAIRAAFVCFEDEIFWSYKEEN